MIFHEISVTNYTILLNQLKSKIHLKKKSDPQIKIMADNGNINAMYQYANMLKNGNDVPVDTNKAYHYYKMAAEHGHVNSMYEYALMLENRKSSLDIQKAAMYFKKAADKGHLDACAKYVSILRGDIDKLPKVPSKKSQRRSETMTELVRYYNKYSGLFLKNKKMVKNNR